MGARFLLDTNTVIYLLNSSLPLHSVSFMAKILSEDSCNICVISQMEILGFKFATQEEDLIAQDFVDDSMIFGITDPVVQKTIALRKVHKIKLPDAIIAATAITHDLTLISRNDRDFVKLMA